MWSIYQKIAVNASVSRSYKLALSTGDDLIVIGTDAGLMSAPVNTKDMRLATVGKMPAQNKRFY